MTPNIKLAYSESKIDPYVLAQLKAMDEKDADEFLKLIAKNPTMSLAAAEGLAESLSQPHIQDTTA